MASRFQISYDFDAPPQHVIDAGLHLAARYETLATLGGYGQSIRAVDLPDGWMAYIVNLPHSKTVHFVGENAELAARRQDEEYVRPSTTVIPILYHYTGISTDHVLITAGESVIAKAGYTNGAADSNSLKTSTTYFIDNNESIVTKYNISNSKEYSSLACFKVGVAVDPAIRQSSSDANRFQGYRCDPRRYTGMLPTVIQLLLGVGKVLPSEIDGDKTDIEYAKDSRAASITDDDLQSYGSLTLDSGSAAKMSLKYDYRWGRTHGIVWARRTPKPDAPFIQSADPDRIWEPFLCEIGTRGILLMPLPRDGASFDPAVRDVYLSLNPTLRNVIPLASDVVPEDMDQELKDVATNYVRAQKNLINSGKSDVFSLLGGFPIDECFPQDDAELERLINSGVIIRLDVIDWFYSYNAVSSDHGWAFTTFVNWMDAGFPADHSMATNLCYSQFYDGYVEYSYAYVLHFDISQVGRTYTSLAGSVIQVFGLTKFVDIYKATLLSDEQAEYLLLYGTYEDFLDMPCDSEWVASVYYSLVEWNYLGQESALGNRYYMQSCQGGCLAEHPFNNVPLTYYGGAALEPSFSYSSLLYKAWDSISNMYHFLDTTLKPKYYNYREIIYDGFQFIPYKTFFVYDVCASFGKCFGSARYGRTCFFVRDNNTNDTYSPDFNFYTKYYLDSADATILNVGLTPDYHVWPHAHACVSVNRNRYYIGYDTSTRYVSDNLEAVWVPDGNLASNFLSDISAQFYSWAVALPDVGVVDWAGNTTCLPGVVNGSPTPCLRSVYIDEYPSEPYSFYVVLDIKDSRAGFVALNFLNFGYDINVTLDTKVVYGGSDFCNTFVNPITAIPGGGDCSDDFIYVAAENCFGCAYPPYSLMYTEYYVADYSGGTYNEVVHATAYCLERSYDNYLFFIARQGSAETDFIFRGYYREHDGPDPCCDPVFEAGYAYGNFHVSAHLNNSMWPILAEYTNPFKSPPPIEMFRNSCGGTEDTYIFFNLPAEPSMLGTTSYGHTYYYIAPLESSGWYQTKRLVDSGDIVPSSVCFGCFPLVEGV